MGVLSISLASRVIAVDIISYVLRMSGSKQLR